MGWLVSLLAQVAPADGGQWINTGIGALGGSALSTAILWKVHIEDQRKNERLESRLFLLADRATAVGQAAAEVVKGEVQDPELLAAMSRVEALLQERSR